MINTNGFIGEWLHATDKLKELEKELSDITTALEPVYAEINTIRTKYAVAEKEVKMSSIKSQIGDAKRQKEYYYFRSIVDGLYNLLKTYGWKYQGALFTHLRNFGIQCIFSEYDFEIYYTDDICELTPKDAYFGREYNGIDEEYLIYYGECETCDVIKLPIDLNIERILNEAEAFLKDSIELYNQKEEDEEYQTYLLLKEKYEGK